MQLLFLLIVSVFASEENKTIKSSSESNIFENNAQNSILVKIEEEEYIKTKNSHYIGVSYNKRDSIWRTSRWSTHEKKAISNGTYKDEETAAHASDTLARKLITNSEKGHKLNFPDDDTEMHPEKRFNYIGVSYNKTPPTWRAQRWSKKKGKLVYNGSCHKHELTAAHASDTLARNLIANGEKSHKLNFPEDNTEVYPKTERYMYNYIGVTHNKRDSMWRASRRSKNTNKKFYNGTYKDAETAAHASDTLARKLIANGEKGHKINFPDDDTENQTNKRKRPADFENSETCGNSLDKFGSKEHAKNL